MSFAVDKNEIQEIRDNIDEWIKDPPLFADLLLHSLGLALAYIDQLENKHE